MSAVDRSTKRQKELLDFVDGFIKEHGYGPSYREVMNGMDYKSVSTVAVHVDWLVKKGYLRKADNAARSLEVVSAVYGDGSGVFGSGSGAGSGSASGAGKATRSQEKWLIDAVTERFDRYEAEPTSAQLDSLYVLVGALKVLELDGAYEAFLSRLGRLTK